MRPCDGRESSLISSRIVAGEWRLYVDKVLWFAAGSVAMPLALMALKRRYDQRPEAWEVFLGSLAVGLIATAGAVWALIQWNSSTYGSWRQTILQIGIPWLGFVAWWGISTSWKAGEQLRKPPSDSAS